MDKVPRSSDKTLTGGKIVDLCRISHRGDDARLDTPLGDHQIAMKPVDHVGQLALVTQLGSGIDAFDHDRTGCIFQRHQTLAIYTGSAQAGLIRCQCFA